MRTIMRYLYVVLFVLSFTLSGFSQTTQITNFIMDTSKFALYRIEPVWKDMINDTSANFFEVQKAFELFWNGKELPEEEDDVIGEKGKLKNSFINRLFNNRDLKQQQLRESLAFDYKRYRRWIIKTEPYIKEDGNIMTPTERIQLWQNHIDELKEETK
ncbi:MAG: hypothetical protein ABI315_11200 [Bacteroidia bacterium]